jgi:hypothetical protein
MLPPASQPQADTLLSVPLLQHTAAGLVPGLLDRQRPTTPLVGLDKQAAELVHTTQTPVLLVSALADKLVV